MPGDNLFAILGMIRAELPEVSDETWEKIKRGLTQAAGGDRVYVPIEPKRSRLEALAEAGENASAAQISKMLGVSVGHARRLRKLRQ